MKKAARLTFIWQRVLMIIMFIIGVLGMIFNDDQSAKSEYLFICAQSGLFLIISLVPAVLNKMEIDVPDFVYIFFICFCLAHFFCGEILGFFVRFKWWDSMLHTLSGVMLALLSFSLINLLNKNEGNFKLSMGFAILFAFSLAVAIGVIWEIIEFAADSLFGLNMQRAYVSTHDGRGEPFVGQRALMDTMKDLILDSLGAAVTCVTCAIFAHKKKLKIEDFSFIKKRKKFEPAGAKTNTEGVDVLTFDSAVEEVNTQENLVAKELIKMEETEISTEDVLKEDTSADKENVELFEMSENEIKEKPEKKSTEKKSSPTQTRTKKTTTSSKSKQDKKK